jgi:hypothetical protein
VLEAAFMLRRVELNGRELEEGQSPWSIRQTGVYHKLSSRAGSWGPLDSNYRSTFVLIAPSQNVSQRLDACFNADDPKERRVGIWNVHRLLVADSLKNWMEYMAYLEEQLREQVSVLFDLLLRLIFADILDSLIALCSRVSGPRGQTSRH